MGSGLLELVAHDVDGLPTLSQSSTVWFLGMGEYTVGDALASLLGKPLSEMEPGRDLDTLLIRLISELDKGDEGIISNQRAEMMEQGYVIHTVPSNVRKEQELFRNSAKFPLLQQYKGDRQRLQARNKAILFLSYLRTGYSISLRQY
ncbi:hypothetical protein D3C87_504710 [compost metagenome]